MLLNRTLFINRYILNVTRPNVYLFEYESQRKRSFTLYNVINFFIRFFSYLLISFSFVYFINKIYFTQPFSNAMLTRIVEILVTYFIVKIIIDYLFVMLYKKQKNVKQITEIRLTYQNFVAFYLFIISFFLFYFPYKNPLNFYIIITLSIIFILTTLLNYYHSLIKHINIKPYQIFLYLCLSEILPLITMIFWISFQIL